MSLLEMDLNTGCPVLQSIFLTLTLQPKQPGAKHTMWCPEKETFEQEVGMIPLLALKLEGGHEPRNAGRL